MAGLGALVRRLISIGDEPADDDDVRLRKRVGVVAGYILVVGALALPVMAQGLAVSWAVALTLPLVMAVNLAVLARTRRFERYVVVLIVTVTLLPAFIEVVLGGLGGSSATLLFAFLGPVFAILALGPQRATAWFVFFLVVMVVVIVIDPLICITFPLQPYPQRLIFYAANLAVPLSIIFFLLRYTDLRRRQAESRSEELLTNAIPVSIATRLKRGDVRIADAYPNTTVLFADLVDFTPWAQRTDPHEVVSFLDDLFRRFDSLAEIGGVEKIKTIGDSYMAVAGAPDPRDDHAVAALRLAQGMFSALADARRQLGLAMELQIGLASGSVVGGVIGQLRIGLASGSVVGGVIGQQRILVDLWGDTVNLAARMESSGVPGRIQVAEATWMLLRHDPWLSFERRESVELKGIGRMTTYLLEDPRPHDHVISRSMAWPSPRTGGC
jgi:class 3 adenylate cyclase